MLSDKLIRIILSSTTYRFINLHKNRSVTNRYCKRTNTFCSQESYRDISAICLRLGMNHSFPKLFRIRHFLSRIKNVEKSIDRYEGGKDTINFSFLSAKLTSRIIDRRDDALTKSTRYSFKPTA